MPFSTRVYGSSSASCPVCRVSMHSLFTAAPAGTPKISYQMIREYTFSSLAEGRAGGDCYVPAFSNQRGNSPRKGRNKVLHGNQQQQQRWWCFELCTSRDRLLGRGLSALDIHDLMMHYTEKGPTVTKLAVSTSLSHTSTVWYHVGSII